MKRELLEEIGVQKEVLAKLNKDIEPKFCMTDVRSHILTFEFVNEQTLRAHVLKSLDRTPITEIMVAILVVSALLLVYLKSRKRKRQCTWIHFPLLQPHSLI